ncbi:MAG: endo-1,4-beta-xylanase [Bacteroidales bacterium]|nr:endo-1,4-beta-xylanase [Bacteroidales bacterium]
MRLTVILFSILILISNRLFSQNEPIIIEAESGTLGADYEVKTDGEVTYISPKTNFIEPATRPNDAIKVASFTVAFGNSGTYKLFARVRVGSNNYDDDSFFYGNGFGTKNPSSDNDWIICNGLVNAGYSIINDVVENQGDAAIGVWKWIAFSDYSGQNGETPITFQVEAGNLTQTFEIAAREDGFDVDKIAFGSQGIYYTVDNLNKGEAGSTTPPGEEPIGTPLADGLDKFLGCGFGSDSRRDFAGYWNQVTPGNAGKWGWVEGTRDNMSWTDYDEAYQVALDNNFIFKHHVLVWGSQQPNWVAALDSAEQRAEIEEWFTAVAERYPEIDQVEVVNEPLHQPPDDAHEGGYIGALGGAGETGWDWVLEAFRIADTTFADSIDLLINEYSVMNETSNADKYLQLIKLLMAENLIDGIGFQAHGFSHSAPNSTILRNIDTLASTGLPLYVTELDIDGLTDLQQVHGYMNLFPLFWEHPAIKGITLWGFRPGMWRTAQGAYLIDSQGKERPAMLWLRAYLKNEFVPNESLTISTSTGETSIDTDGGTLQMLAEVLPENSTLETVHWKVNDSKVATIDQNGVLTAISNGTVTVTAISLELNSEVSDQMDITISGQVTGFESIAGVENILIYPIPANNGFFTISGMQNISTVTILDITGKQIIAYNVSNQSSIDIHLNVPAGLYIIRLSDGIRFYHDKILIK